MNTTIAPINIDATQAEYDAWHAALIARADDPTDELYMADVMDAVNVLAYAMSVARDRPELRAAVARHTPEAIVGAATLRGTFMGVTWLAKKLGLDGEQARDRMLALMMAGGAG